MSGHIANRPHVVFASHVNDSVLVNKGDDQRNNDLHICMHTRSFASCSNVPKYLCKFNVELLREKYHEYLQHVLVCVFSSTDCCSRHVFVSSVFV